MEDMNMTRSNGTELWTRRELAEHLKVSQKTIQRMVLAGTLPKPVKIGRQNRWIPSGIRAYLRELEAENDSTF